MGLAEVRVRRGGRRRRESFIVVAVIGLFGVWRKVDERRVGLFCDMSIDVCVWICVCVDVCVDVYVCVDKTR